MRTLALLALAFAASSCAKDLYALEPFPCGVDGTCPFDFSCLGSECVEPGECTPAVGAETPCSYYPDRSRCALVPRTDPNKTGLYGQCVLVYANPLPVGSSCDVAVVTVQHSPDQCAPPGTCFALGSLGGGPTDATCALFCNQDSDCPGGTGPKACAHAIADPAYQGLPGLCLRNDCNLGGSGNCPSGQHCDPLPSQSIKNSAFGACRANGNGGEGDSCASQGCWDNLICVPFDAPIDAQTCRHPCAGQPDCTSTQHCDTASVSMSGGTIGFCR